MAVSLGKLEMRFFGYVQSRQLRSVATSELVEPLSLSAIQERKLLSRLSSRGLIAHVRRGLYLVPPHLPAGGI